jgi:hypothetical protein
MSNTFIQRVTKITTLNFRPSDFTSLDYKSDVQFVINTFLFPEFKIVQLNSVNINSLNSSIVKLKKENPNAFDSLFASYNLKGLGPGEVLLYFLIKNAYLGGGTLSSDLFVGSKGYEIKSVSVSSDRYAYNFKTGGTVPLSNIIEDLYMLALEVGLSDVSRVSISQGAIAKIRGKEPKKLAKIIEEYKEITYESYFKLHPFIFIRNETSNKGRIEAVTNVKKDDIVLERVTSGVIKPRVKLK